VHDPTDVVIAGAGPAGSIAALMLARAGASVRLVDRARFPRGKLCGDTLNPGTMRALRRLGVGEAIDRRGLGIAGMIVSGPGNISVRESYRGEFGASGGRAITRREVDALLLDAALAAGVRFDDAVTVVGPLLGGSASEQMVRGIEVRGRTGARLGVPGRVTIAADGRRSVVAGMLGLVRHPHRARRWAVGGYYAGVADLGAYGEMHVRPDHFVGIAPIPGGLANVCLVTPAQRDLSDPAALLLRVVTADAVLRDRFIAARQAGPVVSMGPLATDARAAGVAGLLLAGDAAGFIDPITGDGMRFAVRGGEMAARAALEMLDSGRADGHRRLAAWRAAEFGGKWRFNRAVRVVTASRLAVCLGSAGAAVAPWAMRRVIHYAGDASVEARR
jgi:flavin-dependent dehydrogenase